VSDKSLPLASVGCVFNDRNVWANIQYSSRPDTVDWHLSDPTKWRTFFGPKGYPPPRTLQSVQKATLSYRCAARAHRRTHMHMHVHVHMYVICMCICICHVHVHVHMRVHMHMSYACACVIHAHAHVHVPRPQAHL
jgi:hypothetical protein